MVSKTAIERRMLSSVVQHSINSSSVIFPSQLRSIFCGEERKPTKKNVRVYRQESSNTSQQCSKINRPADARLAPFALMAGTPLLSFLFCSVFTAPFSPKSLIFGLRGAGQFWLIKLNCHTFADKNGQLPKRIIGGWNKLRTYRKRTQKKIQCFF